MIVILGKREFSFFISVYNLLSQISQFMGVVTRAA